MLATYLHNHPEMIAGQRSIESGAAGALPSLVALAHGSRCSVITDYPAESLLEVM